MKGKVSPRYYIQEKQSIKYEKCYRNIRNSLFFARARTNTIKLEEHKGRGITGYDKTCKLCKEDKDIVHFLIDCKKLEKCRNYNLIDRNIQDSEEKMRKLLFRNKNHQEIGQMIKELWTERKEILDNIKKRLKVNYRNFTRRNSITLQRKTCKSDPGPGRSGCDYPKCKYKYRSIGRSGLHRCRPV